MSPCMCGDSQCRSCGAAQGTLVTAVARHSQIRDGFHGQRSQEWRTPEHVYAALHAEFGFTLDPCQPGRTDGLTRSWDGERVFCNPPYRHGQIERWLAKAGEPVLAVYLVPARTGAAWWVDALGADEIRFVRGRLKFNDAGTNSFEWSVILVYRNAASS